MNLMQVVREQEDTIKLLHERIAELEKDVQKGLDYGLQLENRIEELRKENDRLRGELDSYEKLF